LRNGALDTLMTPLKGRFSSKTREMAEEMAQAPTGRTTRAMTFRSANKPKLERNRLDYAEKQQSSSEPPSSGGLKKAG
jgi:hypothetical protein